MVRIIDIITARVRSTTGRLCFDTCLSVCHGGGQVQPVGGGGVRSSQRGGVRSSRQGGGQVQPAGGEGSGPVGGGQVQLAGGGAGEVSQDRTT